MRARFTTSIASADFDYPAGRVVSLTDRFGFDTVPEKLGRQWLRSGVLEPVAAEAAAVRVPHTAAIPAARPRAATRS